MVTHRFDRISCLDRSRVWSEYIIHVSSVHMAADASYHYHFYYSESRMQSMTSHCRLFVVLQNLVELDYVICTLEGDSLGNICV